MRREPEPVSISMGEALLLWVKTKAIIAKSQDAAVSILQNGLTEFEEELFDHTQNFLANEFDSLNEINTTSEKITQALTAFLKTPSPKNQNNQPSFTIEVEEGMTLATLYQHNMSRAKEQLQEMAKTYPFNDLKKLNVKFKQIESYYLTSTLRSHSVNQLKGYINDLVNQNVSFKSLLNLYEAFGEMIKLSEVAGEKCFSDEETGQVLNLCNQLQKEIDPANPNSQINQALPKVMVLLSQLRPFFSINANDFFLLTEPNHSIPLLLCTKMHKTPSHSNNNNNNNNQPQAFPKNQFNEDLENLTLVISNYLAVIKLFQHVREKYGKYKTKSAEKAQIEIYLNAIDATQARLDYQITRPSRLLLVLREVNKNFSELLKFDLLTPEESLHATQFDNIVNELAQCNLYTNGYQAALEAQVKISHRLKEVNVPLSTHIKGSDYQAIVEKATPEKLYKVQLQRVKNYFDQLLNNKENAPQFVDYVAITQEIKSILNYFGIDFQQIAKEEIENSISLKLLHEIFSLYQEKAKIAQLAVEEDTQRKELHNKIEVAL